MKKGGSKSKRTRSLRKSLKKAKKSLKSAQKKSKKYSAKGMSKKSKGKGSRSFKISSYMQKKLDAIAKKKGVSKNKKIQMMSEIFDKIDKI